jgi:hypothetical protein
MHTSVDATVPTTAVGQPNNTHNSNTACTLFEMYEMHGTQADAQMERYNKTKHYVSFSTFLLLFLSYVQIFSQTFIPLRRHQTL